MIYELNKRRGGSTVSRIFFLYSSANPKKKPLYFTSDPHIFFVEQEKESTVFKKSPDGSAPQIPLIACALS